LNSALPLEVGLLPISGSAARTLSGKGMMKGSAKEARCAYYSSPFVRNAYITPTQSKPAMKIASKQLMNDANFSRLEFIVL